jgi:hypothetical protein
MPEPDVSTWNSPDGGYFADDSGGVFSNLWNVATGVFDRAADWIENDREWDYRKWLAENGYIDSGQIGGNATGANAGSGNAGASGGIPMQTMLLYGGAAAVLLFVALRASK